jgi:putative acetyltransferase
MTADSQRDDVTVVAMDPRDPIAAQLIHALTEELVVMYADMGYDGTGGFALEDLEAPRTVFVVAFAGDEAIGCGALRQYDDDIAEVKRMYTAPPWRGRGVAAVVLAALERHARAFGYHTVRLETGDRQQGAIRLYERSGYRHIPPFGVYVNWDDSVCFEKRLDGVGG